MRVVVQMGTTARKRRLGEVGHDNLALVEARAFRRHDGVVADSVVAKRENLVQLGLGAAVHIKYPTGFREELGQHVSERRNHFRERAVLEDILAERGPGFEREKDRRFFGVERGESLLGGNSSRRESHRGRRFRSSRSDRLGRKFRVAGIHDRQVLGARALGLPQRIQGRREISLGIGKFLFANAKEYDTEHGAPCADEYELQVHRKDIYRDKIGRKDTADKGHQPKDENDYAHVNKFTFSTKKNSVSTQKLNKKNEKGCFF